MIIFSHRGLEPSKEDFYPESSYESFLSQVQRGFGLEFDINFVKEGIIVSHDSNLKRITNGSDERNFSDLTLEEVKNIRYGKVKEGRIATFDEILNLIKESTASLHALHFKGKFQNSQKLELLVRELKKYEGVLDKILIFDLKLEAAMYLKQNLPKIHLAPSVAHSYDIERYNKYVAGTLINVDDILNYNKGIYDWVWLDEWDLIDKERSRKQFYTKEVFERLKNAGYKIALVTPELHGISPGLLSEESHEDSRSKEILFRRIKEIISLQPDAVCTDYPEEVREFL